MQEKNFDVNLFNEENTVIQDAYSMLMSNILFAYKRKPIKTISICSDKTGIGKTTIAINLAITLSRAGWKTILIDGDIRKPANFKRLNNERMKGLTDIIEEGITLQEALSKTNIPNLTYLSSGKKSGNAIANICSVGFKRFINEIKEEYDFAVFDTPALSSVVDGAVIAGNTDGVILVTEIGVSNLDNLRRVKEILENANANIIGAVMNNVKKREYKKYVKSFDYYNEFIKKKNKKDNGNNGQ